MNLKTLRYYSSSITIIFLFLAVLVAVLLTVSSYLYYQNTIFTRSFESIEFALNQGTDHSQIAKEILNVNKDVAFIKFVDDKGVLQQSYGSSEDARVKENIIKNSNGSLILVGINESDLKSSFIHPIAFNTAISLILFSLFLMVLKLIVPHQKSSLQKLNNALKKLANGELDIKLDIDSSLKEDVDMIKVFDSFNEAVDYVVNNKDSIVNKTYIKETASEKVTHGAITPNGNKDLVKKVDIPISNSKSIINKDFPRKSVVALVSQIYEYDKMSNIIDSSRLSSMLTDYRKSGSAIVSNYGGIVETLLNDEMVALFNISDTQDNPEMRAISAGVELLQYLSSINKEKLSDTDSQLSCKIGIYESSIPVSKETGTPSRLNEVIDPARKICEQTPSWKLNLAESVYNSVKDHVEVTPLEIGSDRHYSVITVEEGVINT